VSRRGHELGTGEELDDGTSNATYVPGRWISGTGGRNRGDGDAAGAGRGGIASGPYLWGLNPNGFAVPSDTWVRVTWPLIPLNTTTVTIDPDGVIVFPHITAQGIWAIVANIAWDNAFGPNGAPIAPPTHRKLARIPQQDKGTPQVSKPVYAAACTDITYHADLALRGSQDHLSDGTKGYQQQQVYVQTGARVDHPDQRVWIEVYQDSGQTLMVRFDGSWTPGTPTKAPIINYQAPSLMIVKVCDY
jgi:hypothetical protein